MISFTLLGEGWRMYKRHIGLRGKFSHIDGDAKTICTTILSKLYKNGFFHTGFGNYPQFYVRDFGMMVPSLLDLGFKKEVRLTLAYALEKFEKSFMITTHITPSGTPVNFPEVYSPDSLAYLLLSLRLSEDKDLLEKHRAFLQKQIEYFSVTVLDKEGVVKQNVHFGGMRDYAIRNASCYDTVMAAVVKREADLLGFTHMMGSFDFEKILMEQYWTGSYFRDDLSGDLLSADANIYPFWHKIITDNSLLKKSVASLQKAGLDKPFPIKYVANRQQKTKMTWHEWFVRDWETDAIWPMSGLPFIDIVRLYDQKKAKMYHEQYKELIEKYHTFVEVYDRNGNPYKSAFFTADEGMIWCALWLDLAKKLHE